MRGGGVALPARRDRGAEVLEVRAPLPTHDFPEENGACEETFDRCIQIAGTVEFAPMDLQLTATMASEELTRAETIGYASACKRGDVLPACMRLASARAEAQWELRAALVREVGPVCPQDVLDRACAFMPDAPEPRLLRAARSIAAAATISCCASRRAWLAFARHDLLDAARLDPMDPTVRGMLADLMGAMRGPSIRLREPHASGSRPV